MGINALPEVLGTEFEMMVIHCLQMSNKVVCQSGLFWNRLGGGLGRDKDRRWQLTVVLFNTHTHTERFKQKYVVCFLLHESHDLNE